MSLVVVTVTEIGSRNVSETQNAVGVVTTMGLRRQAREAAVQALYMCDSLGNWTRESVELCFNNFGFAIPVQEYARNICYGVLDSLSIIDSAITCASEHWSIGRMSRVDRAILRVATYELVDTAEIPAGVAINEAIEIAKRYSADESPQFINGVLDKVASNAVRASDIIPDLFVDSPITSVFPEEELDNKPL